MKIRSVLFFNLLCTVLLTRGDANVIIEIDRANIQKYFPSNYQWNFAMYNNSEIVASAKYLTSALPNKIDLEHSTLLSTGGADSVSVYAGGYSLPVIVIKGDKLFQIQGSNPFSGSIQAGVNTSIVGENFQSTGDSDFKFNYNYYYKLYYNPAIKGFALRFIKKEAD